MTDPTILYADPEAALAAYRSAVPAELLPSGDIEAKPGYSIAHIAAHNGHLAALQSFGRHYELDIATDTNMTPLIVAANNGHAPVVQYLVEKGADINKARNYLSLSG